MKKMLITIGIVVVLFCCAIFAFGVNNGNSVDEINEKSYQMCIDECNAELGEGNYEIVVHSSKDGIVTSYNVIDPSDREVIAQVWVHDVTNNA